MKTKLSKPKSNNCADTTCFFKKAKTLHWPPARSYQREKFRNFYCFLWRLTPLIKYSMACSVGLPIKKSYLEEKHFNEFFLFSNVTQNLKLVNSSKTRFLLVMNANWQWTNLLRKVFYYAKYFLPAACIFCSIYVIVRCRLLLNCFFFRLCIKRNRRSLRYFPDKMKSEKYGTLMTHF